jgi:hypothetical protein
VLDREADKREIFNKLVLLKEPHFTEVELAGLKFKMKLLDQDDNTFIRGAMKGKEEKHQLDTLSKLVLAASIVEVGGVPFERFFTGPAHIQHSILRKYHEIDQYQNPVINALQQAYSRFQASVEGEYTPDFLGK